MWWINDPDRLKREVEGIEALRDQEPWLITATPGLLKGLRFRFDFDISVNEETFSFTLEYPAFFPETPPLVIPRERQRLSMHQYGDGGELCLEFRPDNWDPAVTGAMMIESTYRLIAGERPSRDEYATVPSAHQASTGQQIRGSSFRFLLTAGFLEHARNQPAWSCGTGKVVEIAGPNRTWSAYISAFHPTEGVVWQDQNIPDRGIKDEHALILRVADSPELPLQPDKDMLDAYIAAAGAQDMIPQTNGTTCFFVLVNSHSAQAFLSFITEGRSVVIPYRTVDLSREPVRRLPDGYAVLAEKSVGIVGCGSLGSKIAGSLARSGVGAFTLVDDDILKPGNLVRHELDVGGLGAHKADGLEAHLKAIQHGVRVSVRRVLLGGQEASGTTASVLDELSGCDLLIDASGDSQAFNFTASVARKALRPMLWAEVYAGGIGGFVARLRPDAEPPPHAARQQYMAWCREQGVPWLGDDHEYGVQRGQGPPLIADDADVAVIAAHTSRMALDLLARPNASIFPHSAYVIGLAHNWIFAEPFDTRPFDFQPGEVWREDVSSERSDAAIDYALSLLKQVEDAD
jgi:molybdopterin/thiamine biosynthesis adenylyltransferase